MTRRSSVRTFGSGGERACQGRHRIRKQSKNPPPRPALAKCWWLAEDQPAQLSRHCSSNVDLTSPFSKRTDTRVSTSARAYCAWASQTPSNELGRRNGVDFVSPTHARTVTFEFGDAWDKSVPYSFQVRRSEFDHIYLKTPRQKVRGCSKASALSNSISNTSMASRSQRKATRAGVPVAGAFPD
jgi:hypothetical protein